MAKAQQLLKVLWCFQCDVRPEYLVKGYKCPHCGSETKQREVTRDLAYPKKNDEEQDNLAWLEG